MSSVLTTRRLTVRSYKYAVGNPNYHWHNTYEFFERSGFTGTTAAQMQAFGQAIADAERAIHHTETRLDRAVMSTWIDDHTPYDPLSFTEISYALAGTRAISVDASPRNVVYNMTRVVETGRSGKAAYRGCISQGDYETGPDLGIIPDSTRWAALEVLTGALFADITTAISTHLVGDWVPAMLSNIVIGGVPTFTARTVYDYVQRNIGMNKADHKYFDRA